MASSTSTYALLGATGQVGQAILTVLFDSPSQPYVNVLVRSSDKLTRLAPEASHSSRISIFESPSINADVLTLADCISGTQAVFMAVAVTQNEPGCRIALDSADAVIAAIVQLKTECRPLPRRLVVLSSAETEWSLCNDIPWLARHLLFAANSNIYNDLIAAEKYLRAHSDLISSTFVKPGGLSHDKQTKHQLSTDRQQTFISFLDLAAGMVEVADAKGGQWDLQSVSVLASGKAKTAYENAPALLKGLLVYCFPWLYPWLF